MPWPSRVTGDGLFMPSLYHGCLRAASALSEAGGRSSQHRSVRPGRTLRNGAEPVSASEPLAEGPAAEGELENPQAANAFVPILWGRLPVLAAADGACRNGPERSVGATGGTVGGHAVAGDVTWPHRTGQVLVHGAARAAAARDGGVEIPTIGDAHRFGGE